MIYEEKAGEHRLTKSTYTARRNTHGDPGALWHLSEQLRSPPLTLACSHPLFVPVAYYYADETNDLVDMYTDLSFSQYSSQMANGYFVSNRKEKSRKAKEVPPPVEVSHLSRYDELVASLQTAVSPTVHSQPNSAVSTSPSYPNGPAYHPHHYHLHTHNTSATNTNIPPRAGRAPSSPQALFSAQHERFSFTNGSPNSGGVDATPIARSVGIINGSPLLRHDSDSPTATQRRQGVTPLRIRTDDGDVTNNGVNRSMTDPALHAIRRLTLRDAYQYEESLAVDYHHLPPPADGGEGEGRPSEREREQYYSSSPSSSPGLSPASSSSSPIEMDVEHPSFGRTNGGGLHSLAHGYIRSRSSGTIPAPVVSPPPVRSYTPSPRNNGQNSPVTPHPTTQRLISGFVYREPYTSAPSPVPTAAVALHPAPPTHAYEARASTGAGNTMVPPQPVVALPSSGSQTFERGGTAMTMIEATTTRSREDETVLHKLSKGWNTFF